MRSWAQRTARWTAKTLLLTVGVAGLAPDWRKRAGRRPRDLGQRASGQRQPARPASSVSHPGSCRSRERTPPLESSRKTGVVVRLTAASVVLALAAAVLTVSGGGTALAATTSGPSRRATVPCSAATSRPRR